MDQPKLERLLRLMMLITSNTNYTISQLANKFAMSERTIYRYIDTFREAGFVIKKKNDIFRIDKSSPYFKDISQLIHFTDEEAYILKSAIEGIDENNLIKQNLKRKLYTVYDYKILADTIVHGENAKNVNHLLEAFENKQQVILKDYCSANSKLVSNRLVEPFGFTTNYIQLWAYEIKAKQNKLFKLSRVGSVEIIPRNWEFEEKHKKGHIDIFRISSDKLLPIKLQMSLRAAHLLTEEYPLAEKELTKINDNKWMLSTNVCSYEGVGRFVLGLLDEITVVETPGFINFLNHKIAKGLSVR
ncbi:MAG: HTH domain-containing protein [Prolixibacteraceae bacterium]|nr:HTH domain-containing protein [Prolixibacteraceae bacterium]MBN2649410.1 HTH domain-containing protein [Prolixibacteraceae bacterium]